MTLTGGCGPQKDVAAPPTNPATAPAGSVPAPTTEATRAPSGDDCDGDPPTTNAMANTGTALRTTVLQHLARNFASDVAFPDGVGDRFPEFAAGRWPDNPPEVVERALRAGAFIYGPPLVTFSMENTSGAPLTVYDVRPANMRTVCMPSGLLAMLGTEGGDPVEVVVNLDADRPISMIPVDAGSVPYEPYFKKHLIKIASGDSGGMTINFELARRAREFDLAVSYVSRGRKYTQLVRPGGEPFRATPPVCPTQDSRPTLTEDDVRRLADHRFSEVLVAGSTGESMTETAVDPDTFANDCTTR